MTETNSPTTGGATMPTPTTQIPKPSTAPIADDGGLSIGAEVRSQNRIPFLPTNERPFPIATLVSVEAATRTIKKNGSIKQVLAFMFESVGDLAGVRTYEHIEWEPDFNEEKFKTKYEGLQSRVKHIYEGFAAWPALKAGRTFDTLFAAVAKAFNTGGANGAPIYAGKKVRLKLVYSIDYPAGGLAFPLTPNFVEPYVENKPTALFLNKQYESLEQQERRGARKVVGADSPYTAPPEEFPTFVTPSK